MDISIEKKNIFVNIDNEGQSNKEKDIIRDLIVGFLIVRSKVPNGVSYVSTIPLDTSWDGFNDNIDIDPNEEIIGIIPAPPGSYKILGLVPNKDDIGSYENLGYEYRGAYFPDWKKLLEEKIKKKEEGIKIERLK